MRSREPWLDSGGTCDRLVPIHPLEPCRRGCIAGINPVPRRLERALLGLLVSDLCLHSAQGNDPDRALDLTQDFFTRLFEKDLLASVDHRKGRFRSFLRTVCTNFLIDTWRRKPEAEINPISIDARDAEGRYVIEPADNVTAESLFDRAWAITLLDRVLALLAAEYAESGRAELFDHLKVVLTEGKGAVRAAVLAERLGMPENAVNIANHRLRERYRAILQEQIAATLDDPSEMDDEIRSLFDAIRPEPKNR